MSLLSDYIPASCSRAILEPAGFQCDAGCVDSGGVLHDPQRAVRITISHGGYNTYSKRALVSCDRTMREQRKMQLRNIASVVQNYKTKIIK